ncbi:Gfo/Idh/MocA family protein [Youxingia wuxianensis]|nr:Gfo/Idh/MocA family oxidoreductase [Youxingia wuxianensis]
MFVCRLPIIGKQAVFPMIAGGYSSACKQGHTNYDRREDLMMEKTRIGVVGCGMISDIYLTNLTGRFGHAVQVMAVSDLSQDRAAAQAEKYHIPKVMSAQEMIDSPQIDILLNLTTPRVHFEICEKALLGGKHIYTEKPLSLSYAQGKRLLELAEKRGLYIGCATDTFLGAGLQTCRKLIDDGAIGKPLAATAFMMSHGWEGAHQNPDFYYLTGGGPMFDMGPYYISALVSLLGPAKEVAAMTSRGFETRTILCGPRKGQSIPVEVPTHITGTIRFETGAVATVITTFDVWETPLPFLEIYGTQGTIVGPDPNTYQGPVLLRSAVDPTPGQVSMANQYWENSRGLGLTEMALAIKRGEPARAGGRLGLHVLEIMEGFHRSGQDSRFISLESRCERPRAFIEENLI